MAIQAQLGCAPLPAHHTANGDDLIEAGPTQGRRTLAQVANLLLQQRPAVADCSREPLQMEQPEGERIRTDGPRAELEITERQRRGPWWRSQ